MTGTASAHGPVAPSGSARRVAYYLWQYPRLSETFVEREIDSVRRCGIDLEVIADSTETPPPCSRIPARRDERTVYLFPLPRRRFAWNLACWLLTRPGRLFATLVRVRRQQYHDTKSGWQDLLVFLKTVHLAGLLKRLRIDHLHCPWADVNAFIGMNAARLAQVTFSVQARAYEVHRPKSAYALQEKLAQARFVVTNSRYNKRHLMKFLPRTDSEKLHVIYNGVPLSRLQPGVRPRGTAPLAILSVGRLVPQKGFEYLLRACRILQDSGYQFRCTIIGAPVVPEEAAYRRQILGLHADLCLQDTVTLLGARRFDEIVEEYRASDVFALPCVVAEDGASDIIPNVLIEAMAMQLPVVSTNIKAIPELITHGQNGLLVPPGDERLLAKAIAALMGDPSRRRCLGKKARETVERQFDSRRNARAYARLFQELA